MKPAPFRYADPTTVEEALELLAAHGAEVRVLAGGQSLMPLLNFRLARPSVVVDVNRLQGLDAIAPTEDGGLRLGALVRQRALERSALVRARSPLLAQAMPFIGHPQIRARGTLGGSLAHADPAAELPAVMVTLGARLTLRRTGGERTVAAEDFFLGPLTTALAPEELLTEILLPPWPGRTGGSLREVAKRHGDFALGGVASTLTQDDGGRIAATRIVGFGVGPRPVRLTEAERALAGVLPTAAAFAEAGRVAAAAVDPADDIHASAGYRRRLVGVLTTRTLTDALVAAARQ